MSDISEKHIENSLAKIRNIFEKASKRIEALKVGEKVPATVLADEIAKECGMTGPQLYPTLKFLFDGYPYVEIRRGAHGGIIKIGEPLTTPENSVNMSAPGGEIVPPEETI